MKISIASDHAGLELKDYIKEYLTRKGHEVEDFGTYSKDSCDYPDFARPCAQSVANKSSELGILVCYTGIGMSMCANKVKGIRAALVTSVENAHLTKEHNNANILCLGAKDTPQDLALNIVDEFINTPFAGGRHERRVNKLMETEE
jgi:ribose 5-phosphate isomerase B